jgi:hypothetical protein
MNEAIQLNVHCESMREMFKSEGDRVFDRNEAFR